MKTNTLIGIIVVLLTWSLPCFAQYDDLTTRGINEGSIGTGYDDLTTRGINEGSIGTGYDDLTTPGINEGSIRYP